MRNVSGRKEKKKKNDTRQSCSERYGLGSVTVIRDRKDTYTNIGRRFTVWFKSEGISKKTVTT